MEAQKIPKTIQCVGGVKNKKSRYVPLNDMAIKMLEIQQRLDKNLGTDDFVFCGKNAVRYDENRMYHDIRTLIRAANLNLPRCGPHMLRHPYVKPTTKNNGRFKAGFMSMPASNKEHLPNDLSTLAGVLFCSQVASTNRSWILY